MVRRLRNSIPSAVVLLAAASLPLSADVVVATGTGYRLTEARPCWVRTVSFAIT